MDEKRIRQPVKRYEGIEPDNAWSESEKRLLLTGLKRHGHTDVQSIANILPSRSAAEIKTMILNLMMAASRSTKRGVSPPIDMWLEQASIDDTNSLIPQALLFISLFERQPAPEECDGCDLRAAYDYIYRMTRGHSAIELSAKTRRTIYKVISQTVSKMRSKNTDNLVKFVNNLYKTTPQRDYTSKTAMSAKIGPYTVLQELNTFAVPSDKLRISTDDQI